MKRRTSFLTTGVLLGSPLLGYAAFVEPIQLRLREMTIKIKNLPHGMDGFKISQITDLHYRPNFDSQLIDQVVSLSNAQCPDLVALTGDYIVKSPKPLPELVSKLDGLTSQYGTYASLGNHDVTGASYDFLRNAFHQSSIELLINDHLSLSHKGVNCEIIGVDSVWGGRPDVTIPYQKNESFKLMLAHEPDLFDTIVKRSDADLILSGHTHGGQCRVPFFNIAPFTPKYGRKYIDGHFQIGEQHLFVSSGVGTSGLRVRFACKPEVVLITLKSA